MLRLHKIAQDNTMLTSASLLYWHIGTCILILLLYPLITIMLQKRMRTLHNHIDILLSEKQSAYLQALHQNERQLLEQLAKGQLSTQEHITRGQLHIQQLISQSIQQHMNDVRQQMDASFKQHASALTGHLSSLNETVRNHLNQLSTRVQTQLNEGLEKTTMTFTDIVKRLTIIDEAQKKITELSSHVVSLQDILVDKRSRGAFGEVQLSNLVANMIPSGHYAMQHTLSNGKRADCILFLPEPSGHLVIDAKFPLETFQRLQNSALGSHDKKTLMQQFRQDVQKHIKDIAEKYIIPHETAEGAMMFIPAEAIFAEIHAHYSDLVSLAHQHKVWLVSPTTLMAVLTTARAVLKDDATKKQMHVIQQHLKLLADDFMRFEKRMDKLSKHIHQAHQDIDEVNTSAKKITQRFQKIEAADIEHPETELLE